MYVWSIVYIICINPVYEQSFLSVYFTAKRLDRLEISFQYKILSDLVSPMFQ